MNFKQQLQEAYEAGYRQSLQEAFDDAHEAYERGEINEEQLDEIVGLIARGITNAPKLVRGIGGGIKKGYDFTKSFFRRPVVKKTDIDQQVKDFLGTRPPPARTPSDIERSKRVRALRKYFDEPGSVSDDELRALGIRVERPPVDLDDALFGPLG